MIGIFNLILAVALIAAGLHVLFRPVSAMRVVGMTGR